MRLRKPGPAVMIFVITSATFLASPVRGLTDARYTPWSAKPCDGTGRSLSMNGLSAGPTFPTSWSGSEVTSTTAIPPGGPVLVAPLVWVLAQTGLSAVGPDGRYDSHGDRYVQAVLAALLMALLAVIFHRTALLILPPRRRAPAMRIELAAGAVLLACSVLVQRAGPVRGRRGNGTRFRPTSACTQNGCGIGGTPSLLPGSCRRDSAAVLVGLARGVLRSGWPARRR